MSSRRLSLPSILAAAAAVVLAAAALPAAAYPGCSDSSPAVSVPQTLWGGLQPAADQPFADTTAYNGHQLPNQNFPLWSALDVEDGTLFASYTGGFTIFTLGDPAKPKKAGVADLRTASFLKPVTWFSELRDFIYFVDAPRDRSDVAVVAGLQQAGLTVFDTTSKTIPVARYQDSGGQDSGKEFTGLYTAAVGSRLYAFAGVDVNGPGLHVYDLNAALQSNGCSENSFRTTKCAGVLQPPVDPSPVSYLNGIDLGGGRHLLVTSGKAGIKVWEIVPSAAFGYQALQRVSTGDSTMGSAVWTQGSKTYLAVRTSSAAQLYDISSCMTGSCGSLAGKEVGPALNLGFLSGWQSVTFSRAGNRDSGTPHLYFGNDGKCHSGFKKEWLYDVSNPAAPVEVTGNKSIEVVGSDGGKGMVDYWSFSYSRNPSGFSQVMPRMGKFLGDHFYRAAWTIMEAHQRVNLDPTIGLFGPIDGYPGTAQTFTASANNCTPASTWQWSAGADATVTGSGSSVQIAWSTLGPKVVIATNAGCGNALAEHVVTILDPAPKIGNVTVSPASATVCQPITFTATGVTGQPPLTRSWEVLPAVTGLQQNGDSATWTPGENDIGTYEGSLTVSGVGPSAVDSATIIVSGLAPLPGAGFAIDNDDFTGSKVKFHAAVPGATAWSWDFGTGQFGPFTSDPVAGPHPEHTFSCGQAVCTFNVRVQVKNCVETTPVVSATLQVIIDNPLEVRSFSPVCSLGICGFSTGENITFAIDASGDPQQYQFDWEAKGSFQAATPSTCPGGIAGTCFQHAYATAGTYLPLVKIVRDGQESDPLQASKAVIVVKPTNTPPPPPPPSKNITVIGPTTGNVGQALTYNASATGCSAAANGWSWNTGGGSGSSTTSSITITFATAGTRAVTATNSGCSGVSGSRTVNIGVNQSALAANFTYAPALPKAGDKVTFDGSASAGGPEFYFWKINGETIQGKTAEYTFTAAGSYAVTLEVSKVDKSCQLGMCSASTTKTVVVLPTTPEPPPPPPPPPALGNGCAGADADDDSLLCLLDGRFRVRVEWVNQHADGQAGVGTSVRSAATGDTTGFFWFFNADNIELLVKMLDGTTVNGHYWFFHGGLSDVFYEITVEDTVAGTSRTYTKLANAIGGGGDAAAFPADAGAAGAASVAAPQRLTGALHQGTGGGEEEETESTDHLLLLDGRFEVTVDFLNQHAGDEPGLGRAVAGTNNAGYFWFFTQDNLELVVKMIDARPFDGHFWVFWTGLSDLKYDIEVKDLESGEVWEFHNPAGKVGGGADTSAFGD